MDQAPYYILPDIDALAREKDSEKLQLHRRRIAANIGDPDTLRALLGDTSEDFHDFYGTSDLPRLSTQDTIDSFLEKFGGDKKSDADDAEPVVPATPVMDYASMLEAEMPEASPGASGGDDATLGVIDSFLSKTPAPRIRPKKGEKEEEKPSLTESFAKIMIKNGNYQRALEIITEISLNNPEKSIYFADQIRFLQKALLIESGQKKTN